ncbi:MFS transporter [Pseudonocardia broussonetiae]|uniref:MFS transporter n=1 Tax=Pseudonocardia broussonetiae TaxID=2736640 RepID=A0A6M6JJ13_9PSEU|nr:MFS transporter [Pseudonocardia broussonetiae]QJY48038.1 MFS transporter [Pseudonocardia broussonetiae]
MRLPVEVWILSLISFLSAAGMGLVAPALPALAREYDVGITAMSVAISGFAAARLLANVGLIPALRHVRLRPVLAAGLGFQATTTFASGLATDYTWFVVFRCLSGIGSAAFTIASTALLVALAPADRRGRAMSVFGGSSGIGIVAGPAIGGALALAQPHLPLLVYGAALGLGGVIAVVLLRRARDVRTVEAAPPPAETDTAAVHTDGMIGRTRSPGALAQLFRDPLFRTVIACQFVHGWVNYGLRMAILPTYLESVGHGLAFVGIGLTVAAATQLVTTTVSGGVSDRLGRRPVLLTSFVLALGAIALFGFPAAPWIVIAAFFAFGLAGGAQASASSAMLADSRAGRTAAAAGVFWMTFDIAAIVGPLLTGVTVEVAGYPWALGVAALVVAVAAGVTVRMPRTRPS